MSGKSSISADLISLPKGGGEHRGPGEKFSPDMFSGTRNLTIPISVLAWRNGFRSHICLDFSLGYGNGSFGMGWSLGIPGVSCKTAKGIPRYINQQTKEVKPDVFILFSVEDLVSVTGIQERMQRFRSRKESLFALVDHFKDTTHISWNVQTKDHLTRYYGDISIRLDFSLITNPSNQDKVCFLKLSRTKAPFANQIGYQYSRDQGIGNTPESDQLYLKHIRHVYYIAESNETRFLVNVDFLTLRMPHRRMPTPRNHVQIHSRDFVQFPNQNTKALQKGYCQYRANAN